VTWRAERWAASTTAGRSGLDEATVALDDAAGDQDGADVSGVGGGHDGTDRVVPAGEQVEVVRAEQDDVGLLAGAQRADPVGQAERGRANSAAHAALFAAVPPDVLHAATHALRDLSTTTSTNRPPPPLAAQGGRLRGTT